MEADIVIEPIEALRYFRLDLKKSHVLYPVSWTAYATYSVGSKYYAKHITYDDARAINGGLAPITAMAFGFITPHPQGEVKESFFNCNCGFYALKKEHVELYLEQQMFSDYMALGSVLLSGLVVEHEYGYRASEMTILPIETVTLSSLNQMRYYPLPQRLNRGRITVSWAEWLEAMKGDKGDEYYM